jgi:DNA-directed RNA polymerase subunit H (RpoH/RPB5)
MDDNTILRVVKNVQNMLINRGFDKTQINTTLPVGYLLQMISKFRTGLPVLDIFIQNPDDIQKCVFVHFIYEMKKTDNVGNLEKFYNTAIQTNNMSDSDEVVFVIFSDIGETLQEQIINMENTYQNVTIFKYKSLLFNLPDHDYVPVHECLTDDEKKDLKTNMMINNFTQLPLIYKTDAACRYYNFKSGDVLRITRQSLNKNHIAYRYVI